METNKYCELVISMFKLKDILDEYYSMNIIKRIFLYKKIKAYKEDILDIIDSFYTEDEQVTFKNLENFQLSILSNYTHIISSIDNHRFIDVLFSEDIKYDNNEFISMKFLEILNTSVGHKAYRHYIYKAQEAIYLNMVSAKDAHSVKFSVYPYSQADTVVLPDCVKQKIISTYKILYKKLIVEHTHPRV